MKHKLQAKSLQANIFVHNKLRVLSSISNLEHPEQSLQKSPHDKHKLQSVKLPTHFCRPEHTEWTPASKNLRIFGISTAQKNIRCILEIKQELGKNSRNTSKNYSILK